MRKLMMVLAVAVMACCGCTIMPSGAEYTYEQVPPTFTADDASGLVYFMRESALAAGGEGWFINEDGNPIGLQASGTYFMHKAVAGEHVYSVGDSAISAISIDIKAMQTYYILSWADVGLITRTYKLKEIPRSIAEKALPKLKYIRMIIE